MKAANHALENGTTHKTFRCAKARTRRERCSFPIANPMSVGVESHEFTEVAIVCDSGSL